MPMNYYGGQISPEAVPQHHPTQQPQYIHQRQMDYNPLQTSMSGYAHYNYMEPYQGMQSQATPFMGDVFNPSTSAQGLVI